MRTKNRFLDADCRNHLRERLRANGRRLKTRDADVLLLRSGLTDEHYHSYAEIAQQFGVTHNRIRQIEKTALAALELTPDLGPHTGDDDDEPNLAEQVAAPVSELVPLVSSGVPLTMAQARTVLLSRRTRTGDQLRQLLASWLATLESEHSRRAYMRDLNQYFGYCIGHDIDPLAVRIQEFNSYSVWLRLQTTRTGTPYTRSTRKRKIATISSFYQHLVDVDAVNRSPVTRKARVKLKATPPDNALSVEDTLALVNDAATGHRTLGPLCAALVVELLFTMGLRVSEICNLDVDQLSWVERDGRAYRSIAFIGKGEKEHVRGIPLELDVERLTPYLNQRPEPATLEDGPALLLTVDGRRLGRHQVARLLARSARRVLGRKVTPHFGRHTFNRRCEEAGISVEDRRDAMGHASVVTTEGYGRTRKDVVNDPSHTVAAVLQLARNTYTSPHNDEGRHDGYRSRPA